MQIVRPTPERFDETLALLRAADAAVYGDSDWTANDLREEWDGLDIERDAWLVAVDGRIGGVAHLLDRSPSGQLSCCSSVRSSRRPSTTRWPEGVENPTGATRLYERAGMRVFWQADVWQKELRAGG